MDGRLLAYQISDEWALFEGYICGDGQDPGCKRHQEDPPQDQAVGNDARERSRLWHHQSLAKCCIAE